MAPAKKKQGESEVKLNFEDALNRLTEISEQLEEGDPTLDEAIELYTEGMKNAKFCREKLAEAEQKIKILVAENGEMVEKEFDDNK